MESKFANATSTGNGNLAVSTTIDQEKAPYEPASSRTSIAMDAPLTSSDDSEKQEVGNSDIMRKRTASISKTPVAGADAREPSSQNDDEYPSGMKLACIVLAIILSIFLASLDMVQSPFFIFNP